MTDLRRLYDDISNEVIKNAQGDPKKPSHWARDLTAREIEILDLVAKGLQNKQIGKRLEISQLTVKSHLKRIGEVMCASTRQEMCVQALRYGYID